MDEPFGALDAHTRTRLQNELLEIWERDRKTVLFVTHSVEEAVFLSDRVVVLTRSPGRMKEIIIELPRPRGRAELLLDRRYQDYVVDIERLMDEPAEEERRSAKADGAHHVHPRPAAAARLRGAARHVGDCARLSRSTACRPPRGARPGSRHPHRSGVAAQHPASLRRMAIGFALGSPSRCRSA